MNRTAALPGRTARRAWRKSNRRITARTMSSRERCASFLRAFVIINGAGLAFWGALKLTDPTTLPIQQVRIEGEFKHLAPRDLERLASRWIRGGFFALRMNALRQGLMSHPWVRDVTIRRAWPPGLRITVYEQDPAARWGEAGLINEQGELFTPEVSSYPEGLATLRGPEGTAHLLLQRMRQVQASLAPIDQRLDWLSLSDRRAWSFGTAGGPTVILGRSDFSLRLNRYSADLYRALGSSINKVELVDMRYPNGFAVRARPQPNENS